MGKVTVEALQVSTSRGSQVVLADFIGSFAVHRTLGDPDYWTVTHTESGFSACRTLWEKESAERMARELEPLADWNFTDPTTVKTWPDDVTLRVKSAIRAVMNAELTEDQA